MSPEEPIKVPVYITPPVRASAATNLGLYSYEVGTYKHVVNNGMGTSTHKCVAFLLKTWRIWGEATILASPTLSYHTYEYLVYC